MTPLCRFLEWDSQFFGCRIARVNGDTLTPETAAGILAWCAAEQIDCLYFLATPDDRLTSQSAEQHGFSLVDFRVTLDIALGTADLPIPDDMGSVRRFRSDDLPILKAIARNAYTDSRFYYDGHFARERCDALYELWLEKSTMNPDHTVLVADVDGQAAGFITCERNDDGTGQIGLLGVGAAFRGQRLAPALIREALRWFSDVGIGQVQVVTQGRNIAAQRSYQRQGFLTKSLHIWYHRWFTPSNPTEY